jgi:hypothetical protein
MSGSTADCIRASVWNPTDIDPRIADFTINGTRKSTYTTEEKTALSGLLASRIDECKSLFAEAQPVSYIH